VPRLSGRVLPVLVKPIPPLQYLAISFSPICQEPCTFARTRLLANYWHLDTLFLLDAPRLFRPALPLPRYRLSFLSLPQLKLLFAFSTTGASISIVDVLAAIALEVTHSQ